MSYEKGKKLRAAELSTFCMQTALVLKSGMLMSEGIEWMSKDAPEGSIKKALLELKSEMEKQIPLHAAMDKSGYFPKYMVNMAEIGETTGKLEDVMRSLSLYYDREEFIRARLKNAILYPAMLFVMMSFVIILLVVKIFPIFENMLKELGGEMSSGASALMSFSAGMLTGKITMWVVIGIIAVLIISVVYSKTANGNIFFDNFFAKFGPTKKIIGRITASRFSSSMSLLLASGINPEESVSMSRDIVDNAFLKDKINECIHSMQSGKTFVDALDTTGIFDSMHIQMLNIGQRTGEMDTVMMKLADIYENEADSSISNMVSFIEPVLVGILSVVIGIILISVMLPLMGIMSSIG